MITSKNTPSHSVQFRHRAFARLGLAAVGIATLLVLCGVAQAGIQTVFYVDPVNGNDSAGGTTTNTAFRTITQAQTAVRAINANMSGDIIVSLRSGTHLVTSTVALSALDSGNNGYNVIYTAYTNEVPIISGGTSITRWTLYDAEKIIYQAPVDASLDFRQIYVNGRRGIRARSPNLTNDSTFARYNRAISSLPFVVDMPKTGSWSNLNQVEAVWISHWREKRARLASVSTNGAQGSLTTLTFMTPEATNAVLTIDRNDNNPGYPGYHTWFYFENAYEFLDQAGEWYLNTANHTLYYKPRSGEDPKSMVVMVPTIETLLSLTGSANNYIHNVQIKGIIFECSNWSKPNSKGYLNSQDGVQLATDGNSLMPGMVQISFGRNLLVERNVFRNSGMHGLTTIQNTTGNMFIGNIFTNLAGGGIYLNTMLQQNVCNFDVIKNNLFDHIGQEYSDCIAIYAPVVSSVAIEHNVIRNCPYSGINLGWAWDDSNRMCQSNNIRYNLIHDVMQLHDDGAGIYSLGRITNCLISGNYIYGSHRSAYQGGYPLAGIYLDNGSCYKTVQSNVCDQTENAFYSLNAPNYSNTFIANFYNVPLGTIAPSNTMVGNTLISQSNWPAAALNIIVEAGLEAQYRDIDPETSKTSEVKSQK